MSTNNNSGVIVPNYKEFEGLDINVKNAYFCIAQNYKLLKILDEIITGVMEKNDPSPNYLEGSIDWIRRKSGTFSMQPTPDGKFEFYPTGELYQKIDSVLNKADIIANINSKILEFGELSPGVGGRFSEIVDNYSISMSGTSSSSPEKCLNGTTSYSFKIEKIQDKLIIRDITISGNWVGSGVDQRILQLPGSCSTEGASVKIATYSGMAFNPFEMYSDNVFIDNEGFILLNKSNRSSLNSIMITNTSAFLVDYFSDRITNN